MAEMDLTKDEPALEDDVLSALLNPIRDLTQNWEINLSRILQNYLDELSNDDIDAEEILRSINFTKAAILVQKSADIYGKKVDYLWQVLNRVYEAICNQRSQNEDGAEGGPSNKRNRGRSDTLNLSPDFCEIGKEVYEPSAAIDTRVQEVQSKTKSLPIYNPQLDALLGVKKIELYGAKGNAIGNKYDYRVNKYTSNGGLLLNEPEFCLVRVPYTPFPNYETSINSPGANEHFENDVEAEDFVEAGGAFAAAESEAIATVEENPDTGKDATDKNTCAGENKVEDKTCEKNKSAESDPWQAVSSDISQNVMQPRSTARIPEIAEQVMLTMQKKKKSSSENVGDTVINRPRTLMSFLMEDILVKGRVRGYYLATQEFYNQRKDKNKDTDEYDEVTRDVASEFSHEFCGFKDSDVTGDNDWQNVSFDVGINDVEELAILDAGPTVELPVPDASYEDFVREALVVPSLNQQPVEGLAERVNQWHDSIRNRLKDSEKRGHFNIHAYCDLVLSRFPDTEEHPILPFQKIVGEKEKVENVCRYFLACLMLANAYNVELIRTKKEPLSMDCMNVKLLSRVRNQALLKEMYE